MANFSRRVRRIASSKRSVRYAKAEADGKIGELDTLKLQLALRPPPRGFTHALRDAARAKVRKLEKQARFAQELARVESEVQS